MSANSRTVAVVRGQLSKFSGIICKDLRKAKQKLVREMIYGIQAAKDVKLSNITRSLNDPLPLIKTEDRLSRNLDDRTEMGDGDVHWIMYEVARPLSINLRGGYHINCPFGYVGRGRACVATRRLNLPRHGTETARSVRVSPSQGCRPKPQAAA